MQVLEIFKAFETRDISKKNAVTLLLVILAGYCIVTLLQTGFFSQEIEFHGVILKEDCLHYGKFKDRNLCGDYVLRERYLSEFNYDRLYNDFKHWSMFVPLVISRDYLGNPQILTLVSSVLMLCFTALLTRQLTNRNYPALIAVLYVLQSPIFYKYDTGITYPTFWATFYLASLYLMFRVPHSSWLAFGLSIAMKNIIVLYLASSVIFAYFSKVKAKKLVIISHILIVGIGIGFVLIHEPTRVAVASQLQVDLDDFVVWLGMWAIEFSADRVSLFMMMFCIAALYILKRQHVSNATAVLLVMISILIQPAFISGFTIYTNEEYRFQISIAFIGVALGLVLCNLNKLAYGIQRPTSSGTYD